MKRALRIGVLACCLVFTAGRITEAQDPGAFVFVEVDPTVVPSVTFSPPCDDLDWWMWWMSGCYWMSVGT